MCKLAVPSNWLRKDKLKLVLRLLLSTLKKIKKKKRKEKKRNETKRNETKMQLSSLPR
jgi:hypothetical protein